MTFNADTQSAIIITCLYQICLLKASLVGRCKHLPDSRGTQITAYFCIQLASKSSSLISYIIHGSSQPISLSLRALKICKIHRENILKRPIYFTFLTYYSICSVRPIHIFTHSISIQTTKYLFHQVYKLAKG